MEATFEVLTPPAVDDLYFWALQVNFVDERGRNRGGAHFGLQHHSGHPNGGAVNWGGYGPDGTILVGTTSPLPSAMSNDNTRDYRWHPGRAYRYTIERSPGGDGWRGSITDTSSGTTTIVRDLLVDTPYLASPMVWSEVFAPCDAPPVMVRWSGLRAHGERGIVVAKSVRLNYQRYEDGGCTNTTTTVDPSGQGFIQITSTPRIDPKGTRLTII